MTSNGSGCLPEVYIHWFRRTSTVTESTLGEATLNLEHLIENYFDKELILWPNIKYCFVCKRQMVYIALVFFMDYEKKL